MSKAKADYDKRSSTMVPGGEAAQLLKARYTVSRYKAVFGGDLPWDWGMTITYAISLIDADKAARAQAKKAKEDAKEQRREAKVGKKRARED